LHPTSRSSNRLGRLEALPAIWNHGDLQMKKAMVDMSKVALDVAASTFSGTLDATSGVPAC